MSVVRRVRDVAGSLAVGSKRQARRAKRKLELKRLESKIASEEAAIGRALFPGLASGELRVQSPGVDEHVRALTRLRANLERKRAASDEFGETAGANGAPGSPPLDPPSDPYRDALADGVITADEVIEIQRDANVRPE